MRIGIVGLPYVGKTSLFNALTQSQAETGTYIAKKGSNLSSVKVPDERLESLAQLLNPKKVIPTSIDYVDLAGVSKGEVAQGALETGVIADLRGVDALLHVVRVFADDTVPHVEGSVDAKRDIETIDIELTFADLQVIDRRLDRLRRELRTQSVPALEHERTVLEKCKAALEGGTSLREIEFSPEDEKAIRGYGFLTQKPMLLILNIGEDQLDQAEALSTAVASYAQQPQTEIIALAAKLEMEIGQLDADDAEIFLSEMGLNESALIRVIHGSYRLLGLITFFTVLSSELKAWTLKGGMTALDAARAIHTDIARGFIRAETIHWETLVECGSLVKAREQGLLSLEGKDYVVHDGDVLTIRFNV
ncbi:MAG: redox-regulated ATPase YchF [Candidatus Poribacteria bacterium]|nr:redox-regulated ATPase YchF [Candidatus Poribacteria bacterium]